MPEIVMPRLSDSMEEGTILQWLKSVGDDVALGDELVEIETDKANMAYESDVAGTLTEIVAEEGETLPIGATIARIGEDGEVPKEEKKQKAAEAAAPAAVEAPPTPAPPSSTDGRPKASPVARRIAKEKGLDLSQLHGSGPGGRIVKADVEKAEAGAPATAPTPSPAAVSEVPRDREGADDLPGPDQAAVDDRPADGGVEGDRASLLFGGGDRHEPGGGGSGADQGGGRRGRCRAVVQRHGGQGVRAGAARAPSRQRRLPRRPLRALLAGQRRDRRRRPGRPRRSHRLRRRPQGPAADRRGVARRWHGECATVRSPRRSSPAQPSPSPTWGCTGSTASRR